MCARACAFAQGLLRVFMFMSNKSYTTMELSEASLCESFLWALRAIHLKKKDNKERKKIKQVMRWKEWEDLTQLYQVFRCSGVWTQRSEVRSSETLCERVSVVVGETVGFSCGRWQVPLASVHIWGGGSHRQSGPVGDRSEGSKVRKQSPRGSLIKQIKVQWHKSTVHYKTR